MLWENHVERALHSLISIKHLPQANNLFECLKTRARLLQAEPSVSDTASVAFAMSVYQFIMKCLAAQPSVGGACTFVIPASLAFL